MNTQQLAAVICRMAHVISANDEIPLTSAADEVWAHYTDMHPALDANEVWRCVIETLSSGG
jgi:hypothetical protein